MSWIAVQAYTTKNYLSIGTQRPDMSSWDINLTPSCTFGQNAWGVVSTLIDIAKYGIPTIFVKLRFLENPNNLGYAEIIEEPILFEGLTLYRVVARYYSADKFKFTNLERMTDVYTIECAKNGKNYKLMVPQDDSGSLYAIENSAPGQLATPEEMFVITSIRPEPA